jgi:hypothetical protein
MKLKHPLFSATASGKVAALLSYANNPHHPSVRFLPIVSEKQKRAASHARSLRLRSSNAPRITAEHLALNIAQRAKYSSRSALVPSVALLKTSSPYPIVRPLMLGTRFKSPVTLHLSRLIQFI